MSETIPSRNEPVPYPTTVVKHRPVERRPGPFGDLGTYAKVTRYAKHGSDPERRAAQAKARRALNALDKRRGVTRDYVAPKGVRTREFYPLTRDRVSDDRLRELAEQGLLAGQIAKMTGIGIKTVRTSCAAIGAPLRNGSVPKVSDRVDLLEAERLHDSGLTWETIAAHFGVNRESLRKAIRRWHEAHPEAGEAA